MLKHLSYLFVLFSLFLIPLNLEASCHIPLTAIAKIISTLPSLNREKALKEMEDQEVDVLISGGGATGLSTAHSASSMGLKVAVVERGDFASGTSGGSTKINHGGVRYLKDAIFDLFKLQFQSGVKKYQLVKEGLHERNISLKNAPHNVNPLSIFTPSYTYFELIQMWIGLKMYEKLAGKSPFPKTRYVSKKEALKLYPGLKEKGLKGGVLYSDGQFNDTQMALDLAQTAAKQGAMIANYAEVTELIKEQDGKIIGAVIEDKLSGLKRNVFAKVIINASGPFSDELRKIDNPDSQPLLKTSSGVHVILTKKILPGDGGILIPKTDDGRVLFVLPWQDHVLVGTTDHQEKPSYNAKSTDSEIKEIFYELGKIFEKPPVESDRLSDWKAFRPLLVSKGDTKTAVRDFHVETSPSGLVTFVGGKWTNARYMGDKAAEKAVEVGQLTPLQKSQTENRKLIGGENYSNNIIPLLERQYGFSSDIASHLAHTYGDRAEIVAQLSELGYASRLHPDLPNIEAEIIFAVFIQSAITPIDVLARRTRMGFLNKEATLHALPRVVQVMGELLNWSDVERTNQLSKSQEYFNH